MDRGDEPFKMQTAKPEVDLVSVVQAPFDDEGAAAFGVVRGNT